MNREALVESYFERLLEEFPDRFFPYLLTEDAYQGEEEEIVRLLRGKKWTEVEPEALSQFWNGLGCLLTPEAFFYYLPAFLMFAIRDENRGLETADMIESSLSSYEYDLPYLLTITETRRQIIRRGLSLSTGLKHPIDGRRITQYRLRSLLRSDFLTASEITRPNKIQPHGLDAFFLTQSKKNAKNWFEIYELRIEERQLETWMEGMSFAQRAYYLPWALDLVLQRYSLIGKRAKLRQLGRLRSLFEMPEVFGGLDRKQKRVYRAIVRYVEVRTEQFGW